MTEHPPYKKPEELGIGLHGQPRNSGDAWAVGPDGERFWGRFGAAGLLAYDIAKGVLMQHRVGWSHFGGTWGIPGGARHEGEAAIEAALREATEEAGVPRRQVKLIATRTLDLGYWSYVTVIVDVIEPFDPEALDAESLELQWVPLDQVTRKPLHPKFAESWPELRAILEQR